MLVGALQSARRAKPTVVAPATVEIVVAAEDLQANRTVRASSITVKEVLRSEAPEGFISDGIRVIGKVLAVSLLKGEPITSAHLQATGEVARVAHVIPEGKGLLSLSVPADHAAGGLVMAGSIVDVMASVREPDSKKVLHGCLLERVQVWAVGRQTLLPAETPEKGKEKGASVRRVASGGAISLLLDEEQQRLLLMAQYLGATISIVLRNPEDTASRAGAVEFLLKLEDIWRRVVSNPRSDEGQEIGTPTGPPPSEGHADDGKEETPPPAGQEIVGLVKAMKDAEGMVLAVTLTAPKGTEYAVAIDGGKGRELGDKMDGKKVVARGVVTQTEKPRPKWAVEEIRGGKSTSKDFELPVEGQAYDLGLVVLDYREWKTSDVEGVAGQTGPGRAEPNNKNQNLGKQGASGNGGKPDVHAHHLDW